MILLFELIVLTSIWVLGLTIVTQQGMALYSVREWADTKGTWTEPLITCHWCMPSIHSVVGFGFAVAMNLIGGFSWVLVAMYPLVVMGSSLVNGLIWGWYLKVNAETEFFKIEQEMEDYSQWEDDE